MFFISILRVFKFAAQNFWRNIWLSVVTITIIILTLFSLTALIVLNVISNQTFETVKDRVDISIYFKNNAPPQQAVLIKQEIEKLPSIKEVKLITAEEALRRFKELHADDAMIQETLAEFEENPLGATLLVKARTIEQYPEVLTAIQNMQIDKIIDEIDYQDHAKLLDRIQVISKKIKDFGLGLSLFFAFIALLVVFNTIRLGIYSRREEIGIMRLVGATNWFIRLPFVVESIGYALISIIIFALILYLLLGVINPWVSKFFADINFDLFTYFHNNFFSILGFELIVVILLNIISSSLAIGKYLRV